MRGATNPVYLRDMALLALDLFARIIAMRIDAGPPCMGPFLSSGFRAAYLSFLIGLFDLKSRFFAPTRSIAKPARAGAVKVGRRPNLAAHSALAGQANLDSFEHDGPLGAAG